MFYGVSRLGTVRKHACMLLEGLRAVLNESASIGISLLNPLTVQYLASNRGRVHSNERPTCAVRTLSHACAFRLDVRARCGQPRHHLDPPKELFFSKPCSSPRLFVGPCVVFSRDPLADICWNNSISIFVCQAFGSWRRL